MRKRKSYISKKIVQFLLGRKKCGPKTKCVNLVRGLVLFHKLGNTSNASL